MQINDTIFNCELGQVLDDLQRELHANHINLLNKIKDGPKNIQVQCPYHGDGQEKRPSAGLKKDTGVFHCFACNTTHTLPEFISHCFGHTDDVMGSFGWQWLVRNYLSISVEERKDVKLDLERDTNSRSNNSSDIFSGRSRNTSVHSNSNIQEYVSEEELDSYRYTHPYMYKRRLTDEIVDIFDIGYDRSSHCITFPIRDISGGTLFIARRSVNSKFFNYPVNVQKPLYGLYELSRLDRYPDEIYICESMIDCLTIWVYGRYALAMNGLGNEQQFQQMRNLPCRTLILATDNDDAGMRARDVIKVKVKNKIIKELMLPNGKKDINELEKEEFENCRIIL